MQTNKNSLWFYMALIIAVLVAGGMGYFLGSNIITIKDTEEVQRSKSEQIVTLSNKLFSLFDTFSAEKQLGQPEVKIIYPEEKLILLSYPTDQELGSFAVYDYGKDILYKNISIEDGYHIPIAFVGNDKLLMHNLPNFDSGSPEDKIETLTIVDFQNSLIKTLLKDKQIYEAHPVFGSTIIIDTKGKDSMPYELNTKTLDFNIHKSF